MGGHRFIEFGAVYVTKLYKFIGFGAVYVTKLYKLLALGAINLYGLVAWMSPYPINV